MIVTSYETILQQPYGSIYSRMIIIYHSIEMEYTLDEYKRSVGRVFTTQDGNKYIKSKITGNFI